MTATEKNMKNALIIAIGNSGREDDGLGWQFLDKIENLLPENVDLEYRYQLQVEDAELISHYRKIIFVDADLTQHEKGYQLTAVEPISSNSYTSHQISPGTVLDLARTLYQKNPDCHILGISGSSFELKIGLTDTGEKNLEKAVENFQKENLQLLLKS